MSELRTLRRFTAAVADGLAGDEVREAEVSTGFLTQQGVRHPGRGCGYRNHVLSLRVEDAVGSCAVEPDELTGGLVADCAGAPVRELLRHREPAVRVAALDAYLMWRYPHREHGEQVLVERGGSLRKSLQRAEFVVELVPPEARRVLVVGVVNSLLQRLRERGVEYVPCDRKGGTTEWGEPIHPAVQSEVDGCDAVLATGMLAGGDTFERLLGHCRDTGKPFVLFAQTASAVLPWFCGAGVTAVSAEPYPFFWLDGGPTPIYRYCTESRKDVR